MCADSSFLSLFPHLGDRRWIRQRSIPFLHLIVGIEYDIRFFDLALELLEVGEHFTLLLHREDLSVARVVVDEGYVISGSADRQHLSRSPYIRVDCVKEAFTYLALLWKGKSVFERLTRYWFILYSQDEKLPCSSFSLGSEQPICVFMLM